MAKKKKLKISKKNKKSKVKKGAKNFKKSGQQIRLAIIDLGTNSVRIDIYRVMRGRVLRVYRGKRMIRLGDGVFKTGQIAPEAIARGVKAFIGFQRLIADFEVDRVVAFGTSALRSATNSKIFLDEVSSRTGIKVKVISGQEEGRLIARGILAQLDPPPGYYALVDIGGGSTEVSICRGRRVVECQSFPLGANRLQQMFFKSVPPIFKKGELHPVLALRQHLKNELWPLMIFRQKFPIRNVIGSSGTIKTLGKILKKLQRSGQPMHRFDLSALVSEMQVMTREQLRRLPGLEPKRVDLILAGGILLEEILFAAQVRQIHITDLALRDGILASELEQAYRI